MSGWGLGWGVGSAWEWVGGIGWEDGPEKENADKVVLVSINGLG
jgi:hypothetical protein